MKKYADMEHRHYDSVGAIIEDLGGIPSDAKLGQITSDRESIDGFHAEGTYADAVRDALEGKDVKEFAAMYGSISNIVAPKTNVTPIYDVVGSFVDIGAFMSGEPECMVDFAMSHSRGKSVTLAIQFNDLGHISAEQLMYKGAVACCVADTLNSLGVSTRIVLVCWNDMRPTKSLVTIQLTDYGERFDVYQMSGTSAAPNFWRRILFKYLEKYYRCYGASIPTPPSVIRIDGVDVDDCYYIGNVDSYTKKYRTNLDDIDSAIKVYKAIMDDIEATHGINYNPSDND